MRAITYKMEMDNYHVLADIQPDYFNDDHWECSSEPSDKEIKITPEGGWEKVFPCIQTEDFYTEDFRLHYREILRDGYLGYRLNAFSVGYDWLTLVYVNSEGDFQGFSIRPTSGELEFHFEGSVTQSGIIPTYDVVLSPLQGASIEENLGCVRRYTELKLKNSKKSGRQRVAWENVYAEVTEFTEI